MFVTLGTDIGSGNAVTIGDRERRSGLYLLGKSGMGKTTLIEQILIADVANGHGVFFLDPHGDAINSVIPRISRTPLVIDPEDEFYSFGINPLYCANVESEKERQAAYNRAYSVFRKIWAGDWTERPWLQLIIENTLYVFIENQAYTLAEVPLFFMNEEFRNHLLRNMKYNDEVVDFWTFEFSARSQRDQDAQVQAAFTRIRSLLSHPSIRRIIGQKHTTINFSKIIEQKQILFARLSAGLPEDQKRFIGIIILNELLHAVRKRIEIPEKERHQFCIFVDEFQNFASSEDFNTLYTEARKYGIASVIAHQERFGQFADNKKIAGATAASVNKVSFQLTTYDAEELAPEVAREPPIEYRRERELVISPYPVSELLRNGHSNPIINDFVVESIRYKQEMLEYFSEKLEKCRLERMEYLDEAALDRNMERIGGLMRGMESYKVKYGSLLKAESALGMAQGTLWYMNRHLEDFQKYREHIRWLNRFLRQIMEGKIIPEPGDEDVAQFVKAYTRKGGMNEIHFGGFHKDGYMIFMLINDYIDLTINNPHTPITIYFDFAWKYGLFKDAIQSCCVETQKQYQKVLANPLTEESAKTNIDRSWHPATGTESIIASFASPYGC